MKCSKCATTNDVASNGWCRSCNSDYQRKVQGEKKRFIDDHKMSKGCERCGYNEHAVALQLDHIDPLQKSDTVRSSSFRHLGWSNLIAELDKCRVLCANCHSVKTYEEKDYMLGEKKGRPRKS